MIKEFATSFMKRRRARQEHPVAVPGDNGNFDIHPLLSNGWHLLRSEGRTLVVGPNVAQDAWFLAAKGFPVVASTHSRCEAELLLRLAYNNEVEVRVEVIYDALIEPETYDNVVALDNHYIPTFKRRFVLQAFSNTLRRFGVLLYDGADLSNASDEIGDSRDLFGRAGNFLDLDLILKADDAVVREYISKLDSYNDRISFVAQKV